MNFISDDMKNIYNEIVTIYGKAVNCYNKAVTAKNLADDVINRKGYILIYSLPPYKALVSGIIISNFTNS